MSDHTEELLTSLKTLLEAYPDDCRYDHHRNCQEHDWFGLNGDDCPVSVAKALVAKIEFERSEAHSNRKTSWDLKVLLKLPIEERNKILEDAAEKGAHLYEWAKPKETP